MVSELVAISFTTTLLIMKPAVPVEKAAFPKTRSHFRKEEEEDDASEEGVPRRTPVGSV
jgi:hypothetical protein